jgi:hypothetical protein
MNRYVVDKGGVVRKELDLLKSARWFEEASDVLFEDGGRRVAKYERGGVTVSTVFLGFDHGYGRGEPVLFETMIFGMGEDEWQERDTNVVAARETHAKAVQIANEYLDGKDGKGG